MPRYYFDSRDGAELIRDDTGLELDGLEAARVVSKRGREAAELRALDNPGEPVTGLFRWFTSPGCRTALTPFYPAIPI